MTLQILEKNEKKEFVIITYEDFVAMQEMLEDYEDLKQLRKAKEESKDEKPVPFDKAIKDIDLE